jgi:hypothetical protein
MQERFVGEEVWRNLDIDAVECIEFMRNSQHFRAFRSHLFSRIVPTLHDIGLFGDRMKHAFAEMGILGYEEYDVEAMMNADEKIAGDLDKARIEQVEEAIALGAADE